MKKLIDLPDHYWQWLVTKYGDPDTAVKLLIDRTNTKLANKKILPSKTQIVLQLINAGVCTSIQIREHLGGMKSSAVGAMLAQMGRYGYIMAEANTSPKVYRLTDAGRAKLDQP